MAVVLIKGKVTKEDIKKAQEEYGEYIKIDVDIESGLMTIGGEWHADGEKVLLKNGSKQEDVWGGGIDMGSKEIDFNSLINTKPKQENNSQEILDIKIRGEFEKVVKDKFDL